MFERRPRIVQHALSKVTALVVLGNLLKRPLRRAALKPMRLLMRRMCVLLKLLLMLMLMMLALLMRTASAAAALHASAAAAKGAAASAVRRHRRCLMSAAATVAFGSLCVLRFAIEALLRAGKKCAWQSKVLWIHSQFVFSFFFQTLTFFRCSLATFSRYVW